MWLVLKKELKELLRDRKTLFFVFALPILIFPLLFGGIFMVTAKAVQEAESKVLNYAIVGAQYAPQISDALVQDTERFNLVDVDETTDYAQLIKQKTVDFVLVIPADFSTNLLQSGQHALQLYLNDAGLNMVYRRVNDVVSGMSDSMQTAAFEQLNLTDSQRQALIEPIVLERENVADERESWGERIGGLLPYLVFILCLQGAMAPASDMGAGEKERGTLETLLISPLARTQIILGKFVTIGIAGVSSALVTVGSMAIWGLVIGQSFAIQAVADIMSMISLLDFILIFLMLVPIVAIFSAVLLSLSIYARSFKEAQSYMGALVIFVIFPIVLAMLPGVKLEGGWVWVPLTNVALAMKELLKGTMDYFALFGIFLSTAGIALAFLLFCVWWFKKEKVLFR